MFMCVGGNSIEDIKKGVEALERQLDYHNDNDYDNDDIEDEDDFEPDKSDTCDKYCPSCDEEYETDMNYCPQCGGQLEM